MAYKIKDKIEWLEAKDYDQLAEDLVEEFADGEANDQLGDLLDAWHAGEKLGGKQVYISKLIAKMGRICPDLINDVMANRPQATKSKPRRFRKS